jgi:hypothetical protein
VRLHVARTVFRTAAAASAIDQRTGGAVEFWNRDHHGRLDRQQTLGRFLPLIERLELDRERGQIGHVEPLEDLFSRVRVVVGRAAHQREAGQRDHGVDRGDAVLHEEGLDRRTRVQTAGEGRDDVQTARFERLDHAVIVPVLLAST